MCLSFIYFWRYLVHTKSNAKQIKLLQEMKSQLSDIKMSVCQHVVDETTNEEVERNQVSLLKGWSTVFINVKNYANFRSCVFSLKY